MRNPGGYAIIVSPDAHTVSFDRIRCERVGAGTYEADTFGCVHCGRNVHIKAMANMDDFGSMCRNCMKMVCPKCANGPCVPFMKKLEMAEAKDRIRRTYE